MGRGRAGYLAMKTDEETAALLDSDFNELKIAAKKLINHATELGGPAFGTSFLKWVASFAAIYLLILDRTNWRTNMLTSLLVPYIFLSLPSVVFHFLRGEVGKWIAFVAVVLRLFFPRHFPVKHELADLSVLILYPRVRYLASYIPPGVESPKCTNVGVGMERNAFGSNEKGIKNVLLVTDWLEMPGSLILLLVVAPHLLAHTLREHWFGAAICLVIGCYLLQEHIRATDGFQNSFTQSHGISNTTGIVLLLVFPIWDLITRVV